MTNRLLVAGLVCSLCAVAQQPADARRVGIKPTGSYWGATGEQIDLRSGNLNFTLPLLKPQGRGWAVTFALSYNSQQWQKVGTQITNFGRDVGYGYGWTLMAGSIKPFFVGGGLQRYIFTDASGAEYWLDVNTSGVWSSKEAVHLRYDAAANRVYFRDGTFWVMGSTSGPNEPDAGAQYPTVIQDSNGNQILIRYHPAVGSTTPNTSARLDEIEDVRAKEGCGPFGCGGYSTYRFNYDVGPFNPPATTTPRLRGITNNINSGEEYDVNIDDPITLQAPFSPFTASGSTKLLRSVVQRSTGLTHAFTYATGNTGELIRATLPLGAVLEWDYVDFTYASAKTLREVRTRRRTQGSSLATYNFTRDATDNARPFHTSVVISDPSGTADQVWTFQPDAARFDAGLATRHDRRSLPGAAVKSRSDFTWAQSANGNPYIASVLTTLDVGATFQKQSKMEQTVSNDGNVTQTRHFDFGNLTTPARTYNYSHLATSAYTGRNIRDRLASASVTAGGTTITLGTSTYDNYTALSGCPDRGGLVSRTGARQHDSANYGGTVATRGNLSIVQQPGRTNCMTHDMLGNATRSSDISQHHTDFGMSSGTNFAAPDVIKPNGMANLQTAYTHNAFLGVTETVAPNGATTSATYDESGRPTSATSIMGTTTTFGYQDSSRVHTTTTNGQTVRTTMDGYGRTVKQERLDTSGVVRSVVDHEYDSCACSPMGKLKRTSQPHAPGAAVYWTTYTYDALGRVLTITLPNNSGTSTYLYEGNVTKATDPAGQWKQFTRDVFGNITKVTEPNPSGGTVDTLYTYSPLDQLKTVSMTRGSATQTRTFTYDPTTHRLTSVSLPESGTTTYAYNGDGTLLRRTDAKGQKTEYTYDGLGRVTIVKRFSAGAATDDPCQRMTYTYDNTNTADPSFTVQNSHGRVSTISYGDTTCAFDRFRELYKYNAAGQITGKRLRQLRGTAAANLDATWTYDSEGRVSTLNYPDAWQLANPAAPVDDGTFTYTYDNLGRPSGLTEARAARTVTYVNNVAYNAADQLTALSYVNQIGATSDTFFNETRQYNARLQLTRLTVPGVVDYEYRFSATQNNGQAASRKEYLSGEDVTYQYDSLQRLISAITTHTTGTAPHWGQSYTYDGFGNMTAQAVTKGTAPSFSLSVSPASNRITNFTYDANGNQTTMPQGSGTATLTYDVENRLISSTAGEQYAYGPENKRVWRKKADGTQDVYFYAPDGSRLGTYRSHLSGTTLKFLEVGKNVYFGGRLIRAEGTPFVPDRIGSGVNEGRRYFPYGQEMTATSNDRTKFGTYHRDSTTGLDYADQRYFTSQYGRFMSADPAMGDPARPQSWNRYAYVEDNPINAVDPSGLLTVIVTGTGEDNPPWAAPGGAERALIQSHFAESDQCIATFSWPGHAIETVIGYPMYIAADGLARVIEEKYAECPDQRLNLVGYSHGGNVIKAYTNFYTHRPVANVVTLGTPNRPDFVINLLYSQVQNYCTISFNNDLIQFGGAHPDQVYAYGDSVYEAANALWDAGVYMFEGDYWAAFQQFAYASAWGANANAIEFFTRVDTSADQNVLLFAGWWWSRQAHTEVRSAGTLEKVFNNQGFRCR